MIKSTKAFVLSIVLTVLIFSCGKETQSSTQGGGMCKIRFTISPAIPSTYKIPGSAYSFPTNFQSFISGQSLYWAGAQGTLSTIETSEFSVTTGQNIPIQTKVECSDNICRSIFIECIVNNKSVNSYTKEVGFSSYPSVMCKDGLNPSLNFIIP
jgi:hypothetical protein